MEEVEKKARELDPMAWIGHAFTTSDKALFAVLARRREASLRKAKELIAANPSTN